MKTTEQIKVSRFKNAQWQAISDVVTEEHSFPVTWSVGASSFRPERGFDIAAKDSGIAREVIGNTENACTIRAWPHDLAKLALGHILLDKSPSLHSLHRIATVQAEGTGFHVSVGDDLPQPLPLPPARWEAPDLLVAMRDFIGAGGLWDDTGCFHRAGVYDVAHKSLLVRAEDIGRHNCLDRLAGWSVLEGVALADKALLISARMTASLCAKALRAGFRIIVSRSAVTTAAIAMCNEANATLVGFARTDEHRFTLFADAAGRIPLQDGLTPAAQSA